MSSLTIKCPGCKRVFTPHGLSQHISKTRKATCHRTYGPSQVQAQMQSLANAAPVAFLAPDADSTITLAISVPTDDNDCHSDSNYGSPFTTPPVYDSPLPPESEEENDANITNANAYKILSQYDPPPSALQTEMEASDGDLSSTPPPNHARDIPVQPETGKSEPVWMPAPLVSTPQGTTVYKSTRALLGDSVWAPFQSLCDWELAYWAKTRGPSALALTDLLAIPGLVEALGLSYHTSRELNNIIDNDLPGTPAFKSKDFTIGGELLQFHYRNT
ncbi:hypothetical protein EI94DRAFT_1698040 [Lactarius quietus]|nr:hypothetical protein EI94DRAFT_1698040 [Lactarius quietus]